MLVGPPPKKSFYFKSELSSDAVLIAVGITAAVTLALTLFALQTKIDFTMCGGDHLPTDLTPS